MSGVLKVNVKGAETLPYKDLVPFQGDLKRLDREDYEKLRGLLIDHGINFVTHVWQNEGQNFIIDGHQRRFTYQQMETVEGWEIPEIPVAIIKADSFADAKRLVLMGTAQHGKMTTDSLAKYARENDIPFDEIVAGFRFPEINVAEFIGKFSEQIEDANKLMTTPVSPEMKSAGDSVKQIQLFMSSDIHMRFISQLAELNNIYGKENITDTLVEIVDEVYTANIK